MIADTKKIKIINVVGARPNFMKIAPIMTEMKKYPEAFDVILLHTGQHYDKTMSKSFFDDLGIPEPVINLNIGSGSHAEQTAKIMIEFETILVKEKPGLVIVVGDVNSTLACSITAAKLRIPVAHVEAGLRSFDRTMPEEINRIVTDSISDFLFTTCADANDNLKREGVDEKKIFFVGNVMIDVLLKHRDKAKKMKIIEKLKLNIASEIRPYALLTLHRPSNVDQKEIFICILEALLRISENLPIIFPAHPRTCKQIETFGLSKYFKYFVENETPLTYNAIHLLDPLSYLDFLHLMSNATFVLTDSGGIQEETTVLGVPCLTLRDNTERPVTVTQGTNILVGTDQKRIISECISILNDGGKKGRIPDLWDGQAARRIVDVLMKTIGESV